MAIQRNLKILIFFTAIISVTIPLLVYNFMIRNPLIWELTIKGNVKQEVVIHYQQITDGEFKIIEDMEFYFINSYGTEESHIYSGPTLWQILNQTDILLENSTKYYFRCYDNYVTESLWLSDIEIHPEYVIIAFKEGDQFLKPKSEGGTGPLRAIVHFNLTNPNPNGEYWAKYLNEIIII
ncbi:MAG: hypothetical protein ACFFD2_06445 [Promethearchaeota archaeon]